MAILSRLQFPRLGRRRQTLVLAQAGLSILFAFGLFSESFDVFLMFDAAGDGVRGKWRDASPTAASVTACPADADDEACLTRYAYVGDGSDINCKQRPLDDDGAALSSFKEQSTTHSKKILPKWVEYGGMLKPMKRSLKHHSESLYYRGSFHKFFAFLLHDAFDRVVLMDADGIPVSNLDHLFLLPMPKNVSLAAPQAYWFNDFGSDFWDGGRCPGHLTVAVASVLLLVVPSEELFLRVEKHFGTKSLQRENFDMDIINMEFTCKGEILVLPKMYGTLNSEYSAGDSLSKRVAQCKNFSQVRYMHFSADGKPWSKRREAISYRGMYPDKEVADLHIEWHKLAKEACPLMNLGL